MEKILEGPDQAPLSCGKAVYLVVLLHGKGAEGHSVIDIGIEWGATLNKAKFIAPNGPLADDENAPGRRWFVTSMSEASATVNAYLDEILASHRLDDSHLAVVGFGQGAALALHTGLRREKPLGALVAISGTVPDAALPANEIRTRPPTLLVHGAVDASVTEDAMARTASALSAMGVPVQTLSRPGEYWGLDEEGLTKTAAFIRQAMVKAPADDH